MLVDADQIRKLRIKLGFSQEKLATLSGVNRRTIQRVESGEPISLETFNFIADALGVDKSEIHSSVVEPNDFSKSIEGINKRQVDTEKPQNLSVSETEFKSANTDNSGVGIDTAGQKTASGKKGSTRRFVSWKWAPIALVVIYFFLSTDTIQGFFKKITVSEEFPTENTGNSNDIWGSSEVSASKTNTFDIEINGEKYTFSTKKHDVEANVEGVNTKNVAIGNNYEQLDIGMSGSMSGTDYPVIDLVYKDIGKENLNETLATILRGRNVGECNSVSSGLDIKIPAFITSDQEFRKSAGILDFTLKSFYISRLRVRAGGNSVIYSSDVDSFCSENISVAPRLDLF